MTHIVDIEQKSNDAIDVLKFVLSLMVVAIHTASVPTLLWPCLRTAVPLFFMISAYFFFSKGVNVKKFVRRNLTLYVFWLIVQFPFVLYLRKYHTMGLRTGLLSFFRDFLFGSTFGGAWYIMAGVIAILIISVLIKHVSMSVLLVFSCVMYLACCLLSNYYGLVKNTSVGDVYQIYCEWFHKPYNSFPVALFWCMLGKSAVDIKATTKKTLIPCFIISVMLLVAEQVLINELNCSIQNDCYVFLPPVCICIFLIVKEHISIKNSKAVVLRKISVIVYVSHVSVSILNGIAIRFIYPEATTLIKYITTVIGCLCLGIIIIILQRKRGFMWLRYVC